MPYNEGLADRVRGVLGDRSSKIVERKMFGGLSFIYQGNMACGVIKDELMVRVGPDSHEDEVSKPAARIMDFTGRSTEGWILVAPDGIALGAALEEWVRRGTSFAASLPAK